ncbi:mitochondrial carrier domain-containing protein [Neohortaea acidophila]|uniref:Mitochondrial carrier domain-containing protein n=1 Tax=Neohortaea acidophila TaxID=245834 RepID=A0A6A6Q0Q9_9PEZI|nr:mitochondrial carrier domain-containing protein [Neohortaea acidophila]KAF2485845.1 mitochondrial carrier domain-containing protein [Neohortaea acidophila]
MSATVKDDTSLPLAADHKSDALSAAPRGGNWKGFVAGVFSGIAKLSVGHPFDTIKVRMQTTSMDQFNGPLQCLLQTVRKEGVNGLYKGATPPLIGWMCMDSLMLGSLTLYRRLLNEHVFQPLRARPNSTAIWLPDAERKKLPSVGHGIAGMLAGWTVSFIAAPVEHVKARLQVQYQVDKSQRPYSGPIDCTRKIFRTHGIPGLWHGLSATLLFRSFFFCWWSTYDIFTRQLEKNTRLSTPAINFWAGGLSAQVFWITSYPSDVVKQRIMTDTLGEGRRYPRWRDAAKAVYRDSGWRGYWRGFVPCFLRAFPANAMALVAFEGVMRTLK